MLAQHLRDDEDVQIRPLADDQTILVIAGPFTWNVLSAVVRGDWLAAPFLWLDVRECFAGFAPAPVMGVRLSTELADEIHVPFASLHAAYLALRAAGQVYGLCLFGARKVDAMRMEKGYLHCKSEMFTEFDPYETGVSRVVAPSTGDFVGNAGLASEGLRNTLVTLVLEDDMAPAHGGASAMVGDAVVGTVTSGDRGYRVGMNLA